MSSNLLDEVDVANDTLGHLLTDDGNEQKFNKSA